jgi:hypothetical protein
MPIRMHVWSKEISIDAPRRGRGPNSYEVCLYLFLNPEKLMDEKQKLSKKFAEGLIALQQPELSKPNNFYGKHYRLEKDEKGQIISMEHYKEAQRRKMNECGFFGYLGPVGLTSERVYALTQNRDYIEKDYEAYKTRMRRPRHSLEEHLEGKIFVVFLSTILEMSIRRKMEEYLLGDKYSFQDLRDEVFSAKWRKPAGKTFDKGHWCDLPIETQKLFHIFKVVKDSELRDDIPKLVEQELFKRKVKHGQVIL